MKTLEELRAEFADELRGLIIESFHQAQDRAREKAPIDFARQGLQMLSQMQRGQDLLGRIYEFLAAPDLHKKNGQQPQVKNAERSKPNAGTNPT